MRRLLQLLAMYRPFYGWMALGVLASLATTLANITLMAVSGWFITSMALAGAAQVSMNYFTPAAVIRGAAIVRTAGRYLERLITHEATLRLLATLRGWFYTRLEPLAPAALQRRHSGDLLSRIRADIDTLDNLYLRLLVPGTSAILVTLIVTLYLVTINAALAMTMLTCLLVGGLGLPLLALRLGDQPGRRKVALLSTQRQTLVDGVQGLGELLLYGAADAHAERLHQDSLALTAQQARLARAQGISQAALLLVPNVAMWLVLWLAIPLVNDGTLAKPDLAMLALFCLAAFEAVMPLPLALQSFGATQAAAERLFEVVDTVPLTTDPQLPSPAPHRFDLQLQDVAFTYPGTETPALQGIDLVVDQGERITIMGPSGGGKSTLIQLMVRFYDPDRGRIMLGGVPLTSLRGEDLRRQIAVVSQRTHLFTATIRDNLRLGNPQASDAELLRACRAARIDEFIAKLPEGFDTWVGEAGATLSGGEARRLAIARAVLKDAPILILDEPTEGLDATTVAELWTTLDTIAAGRTVVLVTHQAPRTQCFGPILTMNEGRLRP